MLHLLKIIFFPKLSASFRVWIGLYANTVLDVYLFSGHWPTTVVPPSPRGNRTATEHRHTTRGSANRPDDLLLKCREFYIDETWEMSQRARINPYSFAKRYKGSIGSSVITSNKIWRSKVERETPYVAKNTSLI